MKVGPRQSQVANWPAQRRGRKRRLGSKRCHSREEVEHTSLLLFCWGPFSKGVQSCRVWEHQVLCGESVCNGVRVCRHESVATSFRRRNHEGGQWRQVGDHTNNSLSIIHHSVSCPWLMAESTKVNCINQAALVWQLNPLDWSCEYIRFYVPCA